MAEEQSRPLERRLPPERLPELAALLLLVGFPAERLQTLLADPQVQQQGLSLGELRQAWMEARRTSTDPAQAKSPVASPFPEEPLPPALTALLDLMEQSPDGVLTVPSPRRPEIAALLGEAGFSSKQVETLLTSPHVQERGLTADMLLGAWMKLGPGPQSRRTENSFGGAEGPLTSRADYQRVWDRLSLPVEALPDLRLALQQLGASPEALALLEEHATPQGLPLGQVWQVIKQCLVENQAADGGSAKPADLNSPPSGPELEQWRQLLLRAGFSPEAVKALWGGQSPETVAQLRERLAAIAPSLSRPQGDNTPKPLYQPANLRLRSLSWESPPDQEQGLSEQKSGQEMQAGKSEFSHPHPQTSENPGTFSTLLTPPLATAIASGFKGGVGSLRLGPEARQVFWSQLQAGILENLQPGDTRLSISLSPPELGRVELTLGLKGEDLMVTALVNRPEVAHLASIGVEQLAQALSQHGIVLSQFQVRLPEGVGEANPLVAQAGKILEKKTQSSGGEDSGRRRGTGKVDRFA
jgi:hypothetical protein